MRARSLLFLVLLAAGPAQAAGIGVRAGTLGVGADIGWALAPTLSARLGYSGLNVNRDISTSNVHYDGKVKLSNLSGMVDFSPLPGPFRITGGVIYDHNRYDVDGRPSGGTFTLNGSTYNAADVGSLSGQVKPGRDLAPYLGIGWGSVAGAGVNFYADLGIMFQGRPRANLNASCGASLSAAACSQLQSDTAAEQQRLEDKLKRFQYYPVLNVGVTIGF
jgi:hypothetical protein